MNESVGELIKTLTSYNNIFTYRAYALGPAEVRSGFEGAFQFRGSVDSQTYRSPKIGAI
ncbi:hypothetical protein [Paenibacillus amylolyticus]|uniref:hypothetical protein n=1 Tax=Paenibacillus amylolyticus TaxID=1451 RepID=UPI00344FFFE7